MDGLGLHTDGTSEGRAAVHDDHVFTSNMVSGQWRYHISRYHILLTSTIGLEEVLARTAVTKRRNPLYIAVAYLCIHLETKRRDSIDTWAT